MPFRPTVHPLLLLAFMLCTGCGEARTYEVRGRVAGFGDDPTTLIVEHEEIPGLMPAMTMPFTVRDSTAANSFRKGDAVAFRLHVAADRSWIDRVRRLPGDALPEHPAAGPDPVRSSAQPPPLLEVGAEAPDILFISHADSTFHLSDLEGRPVVLTFIYTRCPLPDYCPLMSRQFALLQSKLKDRRGEDVHLVSVSFDPQFDRPDVLREYGRRYTDDFSNWSFVTGDSTQIKAFAERFGAFYEPVRGQIVHNLVTALIGPGGRVRTFWRGNDWKAEDVLRALDELATRTS